MHLNHPETPGSVKKLSSTKLVPDAKMLGTAVLQVCYGDPITIMYKCPYRDMYLCFSFKDFVTTIQMILNYSSERML